MEIHVSENNMDILNEEKMKMLQNVNERLNINPNIPRIIFIYSLPKVGSTSLVSSLRIFALNHFNIIHIHDESMIQNILNIEVSINDIILYNKIIGKEVYVIDIFREPIERKISAFFEKISFHFNTSEENIYKYDIEKIISRFNNVFPHIPNVDLFMNKYDIPIPSAFDFENKYLLVEQNGIKYIKLRLKDSHLWGDILTKLLKHKIGILKDYETSNKKSRKVYELFKEKYQIPINFLDKVSTSKYLLYYLTDDECKEYLQKWQTKTYPIFVPFTKENYLFYSQMTNQNNLEDKIQLNHYLDEGCMCKACQMKRNKIQLQILSGNEVNERIEHLKCVEEFIKKKNDFIKKLVKNKGTTTSNLTTLKIL